MLKQETSAPSARAKPPPRRMMTLQETFSWIDCQSSRASLDSSSPSRSRHFGIFAGSINIRMEMRSAGVASEMLTVWPGTKRKQKYVYGGSTREDIPSTNFVFPLHNISPSGHESRRPEQPHSNKCHKADDDVLLGVGQRAQLVILLLNQVLHRLPPLLVLISRLELGKPLEVQLEVKPDEEQGDDSLHRLQAIRMLYKILLIFFLPEAPRAPARRRS